MGFRVYWFVKKSVVGISNYKFLFKKRKGSKMEPLNLG
jgi:hypothetical protein